MTLEPVTEKLPLKDVDFGVIFDKECHEISYGKGKKNIHLFLLILKMIPIFFLLNYTMLQIFLPPAYIN
jgi:hypothetical protein